jgi:hypothetical protein
VNPKSLASGKVDVKYIEPGVGFSYYRDHLYVPGKQHETNNLTLEFKFTQISVISDFGFTPDIKFRTHDAFLFLFIMIIIK